MALVELGHIHYFPASLIHNLADASVALSAGFVIVHKGTYVAVCADVFPRPLDVVDGIEHHDVAGGFLAALHHLP